MIKAYMNAGYFDKIDTILSNMKDKNIKPDIYIFSI